MVDMVLYNQASDNLKMNPGMGNLDMASLLKGISLVDGVSFDVVTLELA